MVNATRPAPAAAAAAAGPAEPTVSVIIPCYNGAAFLPETLQSVLDQTHPPLEVLVIDDGSTDRSVEIAASFGPPVRSISQKNQGESVARNRGLTEARGEWVAFLDADDLWQPSKLERQLAAARPRHVAVHCNIRVFGARDGETHLERDPNRAAIERIALKHDFHISSTLVRRDSCPPFPTWTQYGEDTVFLLDLVRCGPLALVVEPLVSVRRHGGNQSENPQALVEWHKARLKWLDLHPDVEPAVAQCIRTGWLHRLLERAVRLRWRRDWPGYRAMCDHLTQFKGQDEAIGRLLEMPVYPSWLYRLGDAVRRIRALPRCRRQQA